MRKSALLIGWQKGTYSAWKLQSYKCVSGKYLPKGQA
jgi:hypothetical protein